MKHRARTDAGPARILELARRSRGELEDALLRGQAPDLAQLAGWEFRGMNTPPWARAARVRKFVKGFEERAGGQIFGYNRSVAQNADDDPWLDFGPRFGWFSVGPVDATSRDNAYLHAALLDYGRGGKRPADRTAPDAPRSRFRTAVRWADPSRGLRDYLVQVDPGDPDLYLGKAYYAVGPARVAVSFFLLERLRPAGSGNRSQEAE